MTHYPAEVMSARKLLRYALRMHYLSLKHTIFFLLMLVIIKYIALFFIHLTDRVWLQSIIEIIAIPFFLYFFAAGLLATHYAYTDQSLRFNGGYLKIIWKRQWDIYKTFFIYAVGFFVVYGIMLLVVFLTNRIAHTTDASSNYIILLIGAVLLVMYGAMLYFSVPLIIIDKKPNGNVFYRSILLSEKNKFGVILSLSILGATLLLLMPGMLHEYFLSAYHLNAVFDFLVLCVAAPIYFNFLLFLINDSKLSLK